VDACEVEYPMTVKLTVPGKNKVKPRLRRDLSSYCSHSEFEARGAALQNFKDFGAAESMRALRPI